MAPHPLVVRDGALGLRYRPPVTIGGNNILPILDASNGLQCCCNGQGQCEACCSRNRSTGPEDATGFCCFSTSEDAAQTRLTHAYAHYNVFDPTNNRRWIYEATATNLPDNIGFEFTQQIHCGVDLAWDWTHDYYDNDILIEHDEGSDATTVNRHEWLIGSFRFAGPRFWWLPTGSTFIPYSYTGNFRNSPGSAAFTSANRPDDHCTFVDASWTHVQSQFKESTITIQALLERLTPKCDPQNSIPCSVCP